MNFTREPIIETVITPREGCKLVVRSSKGNGQEDYHVDAVEVVSFGHSFFFRSLEKPKSFLVPVSDYEILELRETRMVLKSVSSERSIKIGGGRDTPPRPREHQPPQQEERQRQEEPAEEETASEQPQPSASHPNDNRPNDRNDRKRDRRRRGRRGGRDRGGPQTGSTGPSGAQDSREPRTPQAHAEEQRRMAEAAQEHEEEEGPEMAEGKAAPSFISKLFPPPPTLIKETLGRYKTPDAPEDDSSAEQKQKGSMEETMFEHKHEDTPSRDDTEFEE